MKRKISYISIGLFVSLAVLFFYSCQKEGVKSFLGDYSYKTSGVVNVDSNGVSYTFKLPDKIGHISIVELSKDSVLIIKNEMMGEVQTLQAKVDGDSIFINSYEKQLSFPKSDTGHIESAKWIIHVSGGKGRMYDKNTITFVENYQGTNDDTTLTISGENILTVLERN